MMTPNLDETKDVVLFNPEADDTCVHLMRLDRYPRIIACCQTDGPGFYAKSMDDVTCLACKRASPMHQIGVFWKRSLIPNDKAE